MIPFPFPFLPLGGLRIVEDAGMVEHVLHAKSPARAKRRAARGYPQHYTTRPKQKALTYGDVLIMHPALAAQLRAAVAKENAKRG